MSQPPVSGWPHERPAFVRSIRPQPRLQDRTRQQPFVTAPPVSSVAHRLAGRVALVAGGHGGTGGRVVRALAREGADVCIAYYDQHAEARRALEQVIAAGRDGMAISGDLTDRTHCRRVISRVLARFERLDILVNDAEAVPASRELLHISDLHVESTFRTNLFAPLWLAQAALPHLRPGAVIINSGAIEAEEGSAEMLDYAASKGAVHTLTRSLARALASRGIRVCCVAVDGDSANMPARVDGELDAVAATYVMLASDEGARYAGRIVEVRSGAVHDPTLQADVST